MTTPPTPTAAPTAPLQILRFAGPDASTFLQGQLTSDLRLLADGRTQISACNTPQGRVIAVLRLRQSGDDVFGVVPGDVASTLTTHLRRYVLRAKVRVEIDGRELRPVCYESEAPEVVGPDALAFDWAPGRMLVASTAAEITSGSFADHGLRDRWRLADIEAGLPEVCAATSGHFVAQMLNLDLLDGIGFSKGCYTGQEIVARTQNLGRIKRRLLRYSIADGAPPGPLTALMRGNVRVGEVLMAAASAAGSECLAVTALESRDVALELPDGRKAEPRPLPYAV